MSQSVLQVSSTPPDQESGVVIDDLLRCFICLGRVVDAKLCPSCSKMCCSVCITKWLTENRANCPHCRSPLRPENLVNGRFVAELSQVIEKLQTAEPVDKCSVHGTGLSYYCVTCEVLVCSDCAMFESTHKGHEFQRLNSIYEKHVQDIKKESEALNKKLEELTSIRNQIEANLEEVHKNRNMKAQEITSRFEQLQKDLDASLKSKVMKLLEKRTVIIDEIEHLETIHTELSRAFTGLKSKLISKTPELMFLLRSAVEQPLSDFHFSELKAEFPNELVPQYESGVFMLSPYSTLRDTTEVVYSEQLHTHGLTWRLKVYPNGNGVTRGSHLSVFLEMMKGGEESVKYEYRVELLSARDPGQYVAREFASEFESGECWGYNRFYALDSLESMGYLDLTQDKLTFKFYVRPASYLTLYQDQHRYIRFLENEQRELTHETVSLQERLLQYEKPRILLSSQENPLSSLDHEEVKSPQDQEMRWPDEESEEEARSEDEVCARVAGLSLLKKFMPAQEEISPESSQGSVESKESDEDYPCFVWAPHAVGDQEHISKPGEDSVSLTHWTEQRVTSLLNSPPKSPNSPNSL